MSDRSLADLCPELRPLCQQFIDGCAAQNIRVIITETYRSSAEQDADYAQGRSEPGNIITNAKGGQSQHNCVDPYGNPASRAFDFAIETDSGALDWDASDPTWQAAIKIGEALGLVSGSTWHIKDNDHFELPEEDSGPATHSID
jgi:peptidoglycan L-alanyl-D-glutamate endopeptidase CwlK